MANKENRRTELKTLLDLKDAEHRLKLVKELVAFSNSGGGSVHIGYQDSGSPVGISNDQINLWDPAKIQDLVDSYIAPDHLVMEVVSEELENGRNLIRIDVEAARKMPIVFTKQGQCKGTIKHDQQTVFSKNSVYVRRGTKAEPATRNDYRSWIEEAVSREREDWKSRFDMLANLPPGAAIVVETEDETISEPTRLLRSTIRAHAKDASKLLDKKELIQLFLARGNLVLDADAFELLVQSALRRPPTLHYWVDLWGPDQDAIEELVLRALATPDRDKSDAARAIVQLAALYLDASGYRTITKALSSSTYKHFRDAAREFPSRKLGLTGVLNKRPSRIDETPVSELSTQSLLELADETAADLLMEYSTGKAKRLALIGLEVLLRTLDI